MSDYPDVTLDALRKLFPHPRNRKNELKCLRSALDRLVQGEADGKPMSAEDALAFLRGKLAEAGETLKSREKKFTPHLSTFLNQRRYLTVTIPPPANLEEAISVLACYPTITTVDVDAHLPVLRLISDQIDGLRLSHGEAAASYMRVRTIRYSECVNRWPSGETQFIPGADKWFRERRYEQDPRHWERIQRNGYEAEREQIARLVH
jgi:hypothetical protein